MTCDWSIFRKVVATAESARQPESISGHDFPLPSLTVGRG